MAIPRIRPPIRFLINKKPNENIPVINIGRVGYCAHTVYFHYILKSIHKAAGQHSIDILLAMNDVLIVKWDGKCASKCTVDTFC